MSKISEKLKDEEEIDLPKDNIREIELDKLKLYPDRVRKQANREELKELSDNMKIYGQIEPLVVNEDNLIVAGSRRFEGLKLADKKKAEFVRKNLTEEQIFRLQLSSAFHTKGVSVWDKATAIKKLMDKEDITAYRIAKDFGVSNNLVYRTLSILKASDRTLKLMKEGKISQRNVAMVLYKLKKKELEREVIDFIMINKLTVRGAENMIAEINSADIAMLHMSCQIKGFVTYMKHLAERKKFIKLSKKQKTEIETELKSLDKAKVELIRALRK